MAWYWLFRSANHPMEPRHPYFLLFRALISSKLWRFSAIKQCENSRTGKCNTVPVTFEFS